MALFSDYKISTLPSAAVGTVFFKYLESHGFEESSETYKWTNIGLGWMFAYHHEEAIYCFDQARIHSDSKVASILWAMAYCNLPNYNHEAVTEVEGIYPSLPDARRFIAMAAELVEADDCDDFGANDLVKTLVNAMKIQVSIKPYPATCSDPVRVDVQSNYAKKIKSLFQYFENDSLYCSVMVESIMAQKPWSLYDQITRQPVPADDKFLGTTTAHEILAKSLEKFPDHPGLNHFAIHTYEMSMTPGVSMPSCVKLREQSISHTFGHLWHMPSHITTQTGDWLDAVNENMRAIEEDKMISEKYSKRGENCIPAKLFYTFYRAHNLHMMVFAANFCGRYSDSLRECESFREEVMQLPKQDPAYWAANKVWMDNLITPIFHVLVRFGKWQEILDLPEQSEDHLASQLAHSYAKCMAYSNTSQVAEAKEEFTKFKSFHEKVKTVGLMMYSNTTHTIYQIADKIIQAEILYREMLDCSYSKMTKDAAFDRVVELLEESIELDNNLNYMEPWGWMHPARHILGALAMEQGKYGIACDAYLQDLGLATEKNSKCQNLKNIWSIRGLLELKNACKDENVLGKVDFEKIQGWLPEAEKNCESQITASCACKASWKPVN